MINKLSIHIYHNNVKKGFYEEETNVATRLALIHSEVSEALEADRKGRHCEGPLETVLGWKDDEQFKKAFQESIKDTFKDELADVMIRCMDMAAHMGIDLEAHIEAKMRYNSLREYKHGKKY